jgi:hypothetical protein
VHREAGGLVVKIVEGTWPGRFTCAQCDQPSYLAAFVVMGEAQLCWECICHAAAEAQLRRLDQPQ